jgi:hypothetical protein
MKAVRKAGLPILPVPKTVVAARLFHLIAASSNGAEHRRAAFQGVWYCMSAP